MFSCGKGAPLRRSKGIQAVEFVPAVAEKDQRKSPAKRLAGPACGLRGGRLSFSLLEEIPPFFALHKAKVPCGPEQEMAPADGGCP
jgi:hypothetical protein